MKSALTYDDVLLVPQYSDIESRSEIDLSRNSQQIRNLFTIRVIGQYDFRYPYYF